VVEAGVIAGCHIFCLIVYCHLFTVLSSSTQIHGINPLINIHFQGPFLCFCTWHFEASIKSRLNQFSSPDDACNKHWSFIFNLSVPEFVVIVGIVLVTVHFNWGVWKSGYVLWPLSDQNTVTEICWKYKDSSDLSSHGNLYQRKTIEMMLKYYKLIPLIKISGMHKRRNIAI